MDEVWRLNHVDIIVESTVQEGIVNVELKKRPVIRECETKDYLNCSRFSDQTKCIEVV